MFDQRKVRKIRKARRVRKLLVPLVAAAAVATGLTVAGPAPSRAEAAAPTIIPLEFRNNSGRGDQIYVYNIGTLLSTGQQGWADANGTFHAWPAGGNPPTPPPHASVTGPANGQPMTLRMPKEAASPSGESAGERSTDCFLDHVRSQIMRAARVTVPR